MSEGVVEPGAEPAECGAGELCVLYTSGSTGRPRAVRLGHAGVRILARHLASTLHYRPGCVPRLSTFSRHSPSSPRQDTQALRPRSDSAPSRSARCARRSTGSRTSRRSSARSSPGPRSVPWAPRTSRPPEASRTSRCADVDFKKEGRARRPLQFAFRLPSFSCSAERQATPSAFAPLLAGPGVEGLEALVLTGEALPAPLLAQTLHRCPDLAVSRLSLRLQT